GLAHEALTFTSQGGDVALVGWMMASDAPIASVVMVHGQGANRSLHWADGLGLARRLVDAGINVLSIDLRGHGDSGDAPGGPTLGLGEADDVIGAVSVLLAR